MRALRKASNGVEVHSAAARHEYRHEYPRWMRWTCAIPSSLDTWAPPMSAPELYRVEKIRPALVQHYIIESVAFLYHRSARPFHSSRYVSRLRSLRKRKKKLDFREQKLTLSYILFFFFRIIADFCGIKHMFVKTTRKSEIRRMNHKQFSSGSCER